MSFILIGSQAIGEAFLFSSRDLRPWIEMALREEKRYFIFFIVLFGDDDDVLLLEPSPIILYTCP